MAPRSGKNSSDRLFAMAVFVRVIETGNFSRAARYLGISQPTASKLVAGLEARYRLRLLERTTRRVRITDDGRAFYAQAKKLLSEFDELESVAAETSDVAGGKLRVNCPPALGRMVIAPMVFSYLAANPDTTIDLDLSSRYLDPIEDGVDFAIRIGPPASSTYRARLLGPSLRALVASPDYLKKHGEPREPADLTQHQMLVYSYLPHPDVLKLTDRKGRSVSVAIGGRLRINDSEVLMSAVTAGLGMACLPQWAVRDALAAGKLRRLLPAWEPEGTSIYAVYLGGRKLPTRVRRFLDYLATQVRRAI